MDLYAEEYPAYFNVQVQVFDDVYTPEEMETLISIHEMHPWFIAKGVLVQIQTVENNLDNSTRMVGKVYALIDKFMEEKR